MKIMKFGGTSVGNPDRMKALIPLINDSEQKIVVLSAMAGIWLINLALPALAGYFFIFRKKSAYPHDLK